MNAVSDDLTVCTNVVEKLQFEGRVSAVIAARANRGQQSDVLTTITYVETQVVAIVIKSRL